MATERHAAGADEGSLTSRLPVPAGVLVLAFIALALVVTADYVTSYELQLSVFYMLVMLGVAWFCGPWWGALFACLSAFAQLQIGLDTWTTFSEPVYFYIANGNRLFAYLLTVFLVAAVRTNYERSAGRRRASITSPASPTASAFTKRSRSRSRATAAAARRSRSPISAATTSRSSMKA